MVLTYLNLRVMKPMVSGRPLQAGTGTGYDGRCMQEVQGTMVGYMQEVQGTMAGCEHEVQGTMAGYGHEVRLYRLYL